MFPIPFFCFTGTCSFSDRYLWNLAPHEPNLEAKIKSSDIVRRPVTSKQVGDFLQIFVAFSENLKFAINQTQVRQQQL